MRFKIVILAFISLGLAACTTSTKSINVPPLCPKGPLTLLPEQAKEIALTTAPVQMQTLPVELEVPGVVQANPNMTTPVISLVPGRVEDVKVQQGDFVSYGQQLTRIRSDQVGQIEGDFLTRLLELEGERRQAEVRASLAQKVYDRKRLLLEEKIASLADTELAESDLEQSRAALRALDDKRDTLVISTEENLRLYGIGPEEVKRVLRTRKIQNVFDITAPRKGIVSQRDVDPGEMIGDTRALFTIADLSMVWLVAQVPEDDVKPVKRGLPVKVTLDSSPGETFAGVVDFVDSRIDPQTRTLSVRASIRNPCLFLKPEMFARMTIQVATARALFIPEKAAQQIGESFVVYVVSSPYTYKERKIILGKHLADQVEVLQGLGPGDTVVVNGSLQLLGQTLKRLSQ